MVLLSQLLELYDEVDCAVIVGIMPYVNEFGEDVDLIYKGTVEDILDKFPFLAELEVRSFHYDKADEWTKVDMLDITVYDEKPCPPKCSVYEELANVLCEYGYDATEVERWLENKKQVAKLCAEHLDDEDQPKIQWRDNENE